MFLKDRGVQRPLLEIGCRDICVGAKSFWEKFDSTELTQIRVGLKLRSAIAHDHMQVILVDREADVSFCPVTDGADKCF